MSYITAIVAILGRLENIDKKILEDYKKQMMELFEKVKFKEGVASSFDLRQAQLQLYQTQQEYLSSMVRVINTHTELANFLNDTL